MPAVLNSLLILPTLRSLERITAFSPLLLFALLLGIGVPEASADVFLDITSLTPTSGSGVTLVQGGFSGTLGGVRVTGVVSGTNTDNFLIGEEGGTFENSTIDGTSAQFKHSPVFTPWKLATDKVGYTFKQPGTLSPRMTITFDTPVWNPVFHVANLDGMSYTFLNSGGGLTRLRLLSGNGGPDGDGLKVDGLTISDANPTTLLGQGPGIFPRTSGDRSAYGSVMLEGAISYLEIDLTKTRGDGGSFTLSAVPEPSSMAVCGLFAAYGYARYRRARRNAGQAS